MKKYFIKDIASQLKISPATVSFILNGKGKQRHISDKLITKVLEYAKEVNYKPNLLARSLRTGKTNLIVFMVKDISNPFFSKIARIIEDMAYEKGYKVLFCSNGDDDNKAKDLINTFYENRVDGFIIVPSPGIKKEIKMLLDNNIPLVLFDRYFEDLETNYVIMDNFYAAYRATCHLIDNNFKRIAFVTIDSRQNQMVEREKGYQKAMEEFKLCPSILKISDEDISTDQGKKAFEFFIKEGVELQALLFSTSYITNMALPTMHLKKLAVVSFDDCRYFDNHSFTITVIKPPATKFAVELVSIIMDIIQNQPKLPIKKVIVNSKLQIRESSKFIRNIESCGTPI